jgi:hypothetical protein
VSFRSRGTRRSRATACDGAGQPGPRVDSIVAEDLPNDALLVGTSLVLSLLIEIPVGLL